jgi:hypothetical protein
MSIIPNLDNSGHQQPGRQLPPVTTPPTSSAQSPPPSPTPPRRPAEFCLGCHRDIVDEGFDLSEGYDTPVVCGDCWAAMSIYERLDIQIRCRTADDRGLGEGMGYIVQMIETVLAKTFRAQHGHDWDSSCERCDPFGAKHQRELEAERRRRRAAQGASQ